MRRSRREIARRLDDLDGGADRGDCPDPLDAEEKEALAALFDTADPRSGDPSPVGEALAELHRREGSR
jgi:hypothetical protein